jgi:dihydroflavonol-4-reductase
MEPVGAEAKEPDVRDETVLVTGGSGFVGVHCILRLLQDGYRVRTTVRSAAREDDVRAMLERGGAPADADVSFAVADLTSDDGWPAAVAGCQYVLHVASPFPLGVPKDEDELIVPARDGALRVLRAARDAGVRRVVLTSSFAAVGYGHAPRSTPFTEEDWTDATADVGAYTKSKTLAERAAWDAVADGGPELAVVNPVGVYGPVLAPDYSTSVELVSRLMTGKVPGLPPLSYSVVDVRDVADLHVRAMTDPAAAGERFLAVSGEPMSTADMATVLRERLGERARKVPTRRVPAFLVRVASLFDPTLKLVVPELNKSKRVSSAKAQEQLGWKPRSREDAIVATAESLIDLGLV